MLYMTRKNLSKEFQISPRTVDERLKEIEAQIELGRYGRHSIIRDVGYVSCNPLVFADYLTYRQNLLIEDVEFDSDSRDYNKSDLKEKIEEGEE